MQLDSRMAIEIVYSVDDDEDPAARSRDVVLYSERQHKEIRGRFQHRGRTLVKAWHLFPGRYFVCRKDIDQSGKHWCCLAMLFVDLIRGAEEKRVDARPVWIADAPICDCF